MGIENQPIDQIKFYTPTPQQRFGGNSLETPEYLTQSQHFANLVKRCIAPFNHSEIKIFTNGDAPYRVSKNAPRDSFENQAGQVIAQYCRDLLQPDGNLIAEKQQEWFNLVEIAPTLIKIMTDHQNYITLVQESQALNIVGAAMHLVRHPDTKTVFKVGFGGSDDNFTSARLPAYSIPALRMVEQIQDFYENRRRQKLQSFAIERQFAISEQSKGSPLTRDEKKALVKQVVPYEYDDVLRRFAIPKNLPGVELFFAYQAAIAINHTQMNPEKVQLRAKESIEVLRDYILTHHPRIASRVSFLEDKPWEKHKPHTKIVLEYLAHSLKVSNDLTIQDTLETLQGLGNNHGGQIGAEHAAVYAAIHPWGFGDRLDLPYVNYLIGQSRNPDINITIGGKPERHFCAVRKYLSEKANPEGLIDFIASKIKQSDNPSERELLRKEVSLVTRWRQIVEFARHQSYSETKSTPWNYQPAVRPDDPIYGISLITSIGAKPTYYAAEFDRPHDIDGEEYDRFLQQEAQHFVNNPPTNKDEAMRRLTLEIVMFDIAAIRKDQRAT